MMAAPAQGTKTPSVLVVDDEPDMRLLAKVILERGGFSVVDEAEDGAQAIERWEVLNPPPVPSVVVLDNRMPGLTGLEVAEQMLERFPDQVIVLFSAHLTPSVEQGARDLGVAACVSKMDAGKLPEVIWSLLDPS